MKDNDYPKTVESFGVRELKCPLKRKVRSLKKRLRALEYSQRYERFVNKVYRRTVDELCTEVYKGNSEKLLLLGARVSEYANELREIMGIDDADRDGEKGGEQ